MRIVGNGCLLFWLFAGLMGAVLSGVGGGGRSAAADEAMNQAAENSRRLIDNEEEDRFDTEPTDATVLTRSDDGHFYADIHINGQAVRMMVDTGASVIALSRDDARRAGVGISIGMPEVVGQGAGGDVHGEVVTLDRVSLGNATAEDLSAVVLDTGEQSLLGQSFLSKFDSVEIKDDKMVLR